MNIAFIGTEGIPGKYGGFETFVDNISWRLAKKGHNVTIFQPNDYRIDTRNSKHSKIEMVYVKAPKNKYIRAIAKRLDALFKIGNNYDFIHNFGPYPFIFNLFNNKGKTIATIDGFEWKRGSYNHILRFYMKKNYRYCALFPDISIVDSKIIQKYFTNLQIRTHFLPYGTNFIDESHDLHRDFNDFGINRGDYYYFVGRFVIEKNIHRLILDYMKIKTNKKLVLIGKGNKRENYESYIKKLASKDKRIIFTGPIYGKKYYNLIQNSCGYISTSLVEGTSPALLDALGAKKKVLVSDIPENRATLNNLGKYYHLGDKKNSRNILKKFLRNELYSKEEHSDLISFTIRNYSWKSIVNKYLDILMKNKN